MTTPREHLQEVLPKLEELRHASTAEFARFGPLIVPEAEAAIRDFVQWHDAFAKGSEWKVARLTEAASSLALQLQMLRSARRFGDPSSHFDVKSYIDGTAPRLWEALKKLSEVLELDKA